MANRSDRRWFLKMFPKAAAGAAAIAISPIGGTPPQQAEFKGLSEEEQIAICDAAAICFGLRPRGLKEEKHEQAYPNNHDSKV